MLTSNTCLFEGAGTQGVEHYSVNTAHEHVKCPHEQIRRSLDRHELVDRCLTTMELI